MAKIVSTRRRAEQAKTAEKRRLEEKYLVSNLPLSEEEQEHVHEVFERIRAQLDGMDRAGECYA